MNILGTDQFLFALRCSSLTESDATILLLENSTTHSCRSWHDFRASLPSEKSLWCHNPSRVRANFSCGENRIKISF